MEIKAKIINGKFVSETARKMVANELSKIQDGEFATVIIKEGSKPTQNQWGYIYTVVYPILLDCFKTENGYAYSTEDVDYMMKMEFWHAEFYNPKHKIVQKIPKQKRGMNKAEVCIFIENCINFAQEIFGAHIPSSDDYFQEPEFMIKSL
jgi:hypothetical protein